MTALRIDSVTVAFDEFRAVDALSAEVADGEWLGLIGPNGAGKSSLLRAVVGLVAHEGSITIDGTEHQRLSRRHLSQLVAMVPQVPQCPPEMRVADYLLLGRSPYISYLGTEGRRDLDVVAGVADQLELSDFLGRTLGTLSGGELQRVVLARALAQEAPLLLLDEPTSALDVGHQQQVLELVTGLRRDHGLTVLSAMHDLTLAGQYSDRLLLMSNGRAVASGSATEVLTEHTISEHYGASVRVIHDHPGGVVVVPTRHRAASDSPTAPSSTDTAPR
ncbi:MAG: ABC transporter ATP-binding protein [Acidimicrobiales bacterium]